MKCSLCHNSYTSTPKHTPTILLSGETVCFTCNKSTQSSPNIVPNHSLLALIKKNYCKKHNLPLSICCPEDDSLYCEKCILYDKKCEGIKSKELLPIDEVPNVTKLTFTNIQQIQESIKKEVKKVECERQKYLFELTFQIDQQFQQMVENLKKQKEQLKQTISSTLNNCSGSEFGHLTSSFEKLNSELLKSGSLGKVQKLKKTRGFLEKFKSINSKIDQLSSNMLKEMNSLVKQIQIKSKPIQWKVNFASNELQLSLSLEEEKHEEFLLELEHEEIESETKSRMEWVKYEDLTETTSNFNMSFNMSQKDFSTEEKNAKILEITEKSKIPKIIPTQVRVVKVNNLQLTNQEARQLLKKVMNSFVKELDLSGNKLTSQFIADLKPNKVNKYLKKLTLAENSIKRDENTMKKVEFFRKKNLAIVV